MLVLPGIGKLVLQREEPVVNYNDRTIRPSSYDILLEKNDSAPPSSFFKWLSGGMETSEDDAKNQFHHFMDSFLEKMQSGAEVDWDDMGSFSLAADGDISFIPRRKEFIFEGPVMAEKITTLERAGLAASSSPEGTEPAPAEPEQIDGQPISRKSYLFEIAIAIGILAFIFVGWYLSEHGLKTGAVGNQVRMTPKDSSPTYVEPQ
jgi:hypothetical protein